MSPEILRPAGLDIVTTSRGKLPVFPVDPLDLDLSAVATQPTYVGQCEGLKKYASPFAACQHNAV